MPDLTLLHRLKERKLVQWALAYLAGAWVIYEATGTALEAWDIPVLLVRSIHVLLLFGLPLTLILAWYHGEKGRQRVSGPELLMVAALLVAAGGVLSMLGDGEQASEPTEVAAIVAVEDDRPSIAVLPFQNRSGVEEDAYFTDGMHDQIITHLTKIRGLSVRGLTSVLVYRNSPKNLREIGEELNARYLVEGGVQRAGGTVRINVQLIEAVTDEHLWADSYDRMMSVENLLQIQTEIVEAVASEVRALVTPEERARIAAVPTESLDAYELYLLGRNRWTTRSLETVREAIEYFEAAVELDSTFVLAFSGLADAYMTLPWYDLNTEPLDVYEQAKGAATRGHEFDPSVGEVHASLGLFSLLFELDWIKAERHLRAAVDLAPGYPSAHHWYSNYLTAVGRFDEAVAEVETALSLDPRSNVLVWASADRLWRAGRVNEARIRFEQAVAIESPIPWAFQALARTLGLDEPTDPARAGGMLADFVALFDYPYPNRMAAVAEAMAGPLEAKAAAGEVLNDLVERTQLDRADLLMLYGVSAPLEVFLDVLEEAVELRHFWVAFVPGTYPGYLPELRENPRWQEFLTRIGYPGSLE